MQHNYKLLKPNSLASITELDTTAVGFPWNAILQAKVPPKVDFFCPWTASMRIQWILLYIIICQAGGSLTHYLTHHAPTRKKVPFELELIGVDNLIRRERISEIGAASQVKLIVHGGDHQFLSCHSERETW